LTGFFVTGIFNHLSFNQKSTMKRVKHLRKLVRLQQFGRLFQASIHNHRIEQYSSAKAKSLMHRACAVNREYEDKFYNLHLKITNRFVPQID
jgi:hypothetical protein